MQASPSNIFQLSENLSDQNGCQILHMRESIQEQQNAVELVNIQIQAMENQQQSEQQCETILKIKLIQINQNPLFHRLDIILNIYLFICFILWVQNQELYTEILEILQGIGYGLSVIILLIKIYNHQKNEKFWLIFDSLMILCGICGIINLKFQIKRYLKACRTLKAIIIVKTVDFLYNPTSQLINALTKIRNILIPMLLIIYIYAVVGLYAFSDYQFNKCRPITVLNDGQQWVQYDQQIFLCGQKQCPNKLNIQYQCLNPIDYGIQPDISELINIEQGNGLLKFSNIFYSLLSTFKQTVVTGSSRLITLYKQALNKFFVQIYFYSFIYLISYICLGIFYSLIITAEWDSNENGQSQSGEDSHITMIKIKQQLSLKELRFSKKKINAINPQARIKKPQQSKSLQICQRMQQQNISTYQLSLNNNQNNKLQQISISRDKRSSFSQFYNCNQSVQQDHKKPKYQDISNDNIVEYTESNTKYLIPYLKNTLVILCCINLCLDYHQQNQQFKYAVDCIDFCFYLIFTIEIIIKIILQYKEQRYGLQTRLQFCIFLVSTAGVIYEIIICQNAVDFFAVRVPMQGVLRSSKYLHLLILLMQNSYFQQGKLIFISIFKAVYRIKNVIGLWLLIVLIFSIIGYHLHNDKTKINQLGQLDAQKGRSFKISLDSKFDALIFTLLTFYNEQWDYLMFQQYLGSGTLIVIWQIISICVGIILFSKYFMTLLMKQLNEIYDQQKQCKQQYPVIDSIIQSDQQTNIYKSVYQINIKPQISVSIDKNKYKNVVSFNTINSQSKKDQIQNTNNAQIKQNVSVLQNTMSKIKFIISSKAYKICFICCIIIDYILLINLHPCTDRSDSSAYPYLIIDQIIKGYFLIDLMLNLIVYGFIRNQQAYLRKTWINILNILINFIAILSFTTLGINPIFIKIQKIKVLRILYLIKMRCDVSNNMANNFKALVNILPKILNLLAVKLLIEIFFALLLVKLYKNQFYQCFNFSKQAQIISSSDCYQWGGDWIQSNINTSNIFDSLFFLFCVATMEGWISYMDKMMDFSGENKQPIYNSNKFISIFFVIFFFLASLILLNVFVGLSIYNFKTLKEKDTGQSQLNAKDKIWWNMKKQIYRIQPIRYIKQPQNIIRKIFYKVTNSSTFKIIQGILFIGLLISMSFYSTNMDSRLRQLLLKIQIAYAIINILCYLLQLISKGIKFYDSTAFFVFRHIVLVYSIVYITILNVVILQKSQQRMMGAIFIALQLARFLAILLDISYIRKLMNPLLTVLPPTANIFLLMVAILLIYAIIGMELFAFLRPNKQLDCYNQNYADFSSALYALVKFSTMESPIQQISDASQSSQPNFLCQQVYFYSDFQQLGNIGCGNKPSAIIFFLSFHVVFSLLLMSTLIAVIADSYSQVKLQQSAYITKFVLYKIQKAWSQFDQEATGYIAYRQFWVFTAKLLEIYDKQFIVSRSDTKKRFKELYECRKQILKDMAIPIYEDDKGVLCLQFHELIEALTLKYLRKYIGIKIKTKRTNRLNSKFVKVKQQQVNKVIKKTCYTSGQIANLVVLKSILRKWHSISKNKKTLIQNMLVKKILILNQKKEQ